MVHSATAKSIVYGHYMEHVVWITSGLRLDYVRVVETLLRPTLFHPKAGHRGNQRSSRLPLRQTSRILLLLLAYTRRVSPGSISLGIPRVVLQQEIEEARGRTDCCCVGSNLSPRTTLDTISLTVRRV